MTGVATYQASAAQLGVRIFTPALAGVVPTPTALTLADPQATVTVVDDLAVGLWFAYLQEQGGRWVEQPSTTDDGYSAVVVFEGWTVTVVCLDPAAPHMANLRRAIAAIHGAGPPFEPPTCIHGSYDVEACAEGGHDQ